MKKKSTNPKTKDEILDEWELIRMRRDDFAAHFAQKPEEKDPDDEEDYASY